MPRSGDHDASGSAFPALLRDHRLGAGLTQEELASLAGLGVRTVRELERGRVRRPQRTTVGLLASALALRGPDRDVFLAVSRGPVGEKPAQREAASAPTTAESGASPAPPRLAAAPPAKRASAPRSTRTTR